MLRPNSQPDPNDDRITPEPPVNEWETRARDVHSSLKVNTNPNPGRSWQVMTEEKVKKKEREKRRGKKSRVGKETKKHSVKG